MSRKFSTDFFTLSVLAISIFSCVSNEIEEKKLEPIESPMTPLLKPADKPEPLIIDWAGSTWIVRDATSRKPKTIPGYSGFHLAADGRLLLINHAIGIGDRWHSQDNRLHLKMIDRDTIPAMEGIFYAYKVKGDSPFRIRLVPAGHPESAGMVFERAAAQIDVIENHWNPIHLTGDDRVRWPINEEIYMILLPDGAGGVQLLGYGGVNRFHGDMQLEDDRFAAGPLAGTRMSGVADDFEHLFMQRISETTRFVQVDKDLFLFNETKPSALFRVQLHD